ncbi:MAG: DNA polymerase III subunit gamma/tau [Candidatus Vogelbacteria bacterium]|nr:DNA polymerase III subunit gamma/tau [Candidatus Vogelbacteria bacterium]
MSEFVLYRKYRPKSFSEVLGQEHIVKTLSGAIKHDKLSHAYLFAGPRGTGKTSIARIFASEIGTSQNDLYELDAASNNGVDDIRSLCDGARTLPFESKKKVYIIDEVHMLSKGAFNALLKTLEEPPVHVIFILATTELNKVPDTIISRCQIFNFKKPSHAVLREMVAAVAKKEGYTIDDGSADLVALLGDGSFRDTHGTLQKIISAMSGNKISIKDVEEITGAPRVEVVQGVVRSILDKNLPEALKLLRQSSKDNIDNRVFIKMLIHNIRLILLLKFAPEIKDDILGEFSPNEAKFLAEYGNHKNVVGLHGVLRELLTAYEETRWSYIGELPLELALIKILGQNS